MLTLTDFGVTRRYQRLIQLPIDDSTCKLHLKKAATTINLGLVLITCTCHVASHCLFDRMRAKRLVVIQPSLVGPGATWKMFFAQSNLAVTWGLVGYQVHLLWWHQLNDNQLWKWLLDRRRGVFHSQIGCFKSSKKSLGFLNFFRFFSGFFWVYEDLWIKIDLNTEFEELFTPK